MLKTTVLDRAALEMVHKQMREAQRLERVAQLEAHAAKQKRGDCQESCVRGRLRRHA
jgi:hypothetical protein